MFNRLYFFFFGTKVMNATFYTFSKAGIRHIKAIAHTAKVFVSRYKNKDEFELHDEKGQSIGIVNLAGEYF